MDCFYGYYGVESQNGQSKVCTQCPEFCLDCEVISGAIFCYDCDEGYVFNQDVGECIECVLGCSECEANDISKCLRCAAGYYNDSNTCMPCPTGCTEC